MCTCSIKNEKASKIDFIALIYFEHLHRDNGKKACEYSGRDERGKQREQHRKIVCEWLSCFQKNKAKFITYLLKFHILASLSVNIVPYIDWAWCCRFQYKIPFDSDSLLVGKKTYWWKYYAMHSREYFDIKMYNFFLFTSRSETS